MTEEQPNDTPLYKDRVSKNIPVMHTSIEGARKRLALVIDWAIAVHNGETGGIRKSDALEYIGVFLESVEDEMAAITSSCNSLHDRYVEALATIKELEAQSKIDKATINASLSSIHAANDNR